MDTTGRWGPSSFPGNKARQSPLPDWTGADVGERWGRLACAPSPHGGRAGVEAPPRSVSPGKSMGGDDRRGLAPVASCPAWAPRRNMVHFPCDGGVLPSEMPRMEPRSRHFTTEIEDFVPGAREVCGSGEPLAPRVPRIPARSIDCGGIMLIFWGALRSTLIPNSQPNGPVRPVR